MKVWLNTLFCISSMVSAANHVPLQLTASQKKEIGMQIWQNEGSKRYDNLVIWKKNEQFPSLGICHFIWYPTQNADIHTQTFPDLLAYFKKNKVTLPAWLENATAAPWKSKEEFDAVAQSARIQELRKLMFDTMDLQVEFIIQRLQNSWPRILNAAQKTKRKDVEQNFNALMHTSPGIYALIDYLNFKGEGTNPNERYNGVGWGLLQVLEHMNGSSKNKVAAFAQSAKAILSQRVAHAPPQKKHEKEWLTGWHNRINTYLFFNKEHI